MWDQLKVRQFISLYDIEQSETLNEIEKQVKMVSVIDNVPEDAYDDMPYSKFVYMLAEKTAFYKEIPEMKSVDKIIVKGKEYKFLHELNKITAGQYIDIINFSDSVFNLHKCAACFFLPIVDGKVLKYGDVDPVEVAEDMLDARFVDVQGCLVFFYQLLREFALSIATSSEIQAEVRKTIADSIGLGVGYTQLN